MTRMPHVTWAAGMFGRGAPGAQGRGFKLGAEDGSDVTAKAESPFLLSSGSEMPLGKV